ncbi:uncharacterized protein LOC110973133 isoform X2 [Acanthaster planci]|uniref:Uncharacterized protein LOC110973133 isoform X2 n=1 Tax=Acanthaster planci TaxID=133434 RepID=A0A8B7XHG1_ACAPL|nr:uncharacterized protein LOC110973133 isoform X2 [Acanthaster planci]
MIRFARQNNAAANITYCMGDAQTFGDYPEWQERFDKAVSFFVLHWCPDHAKALRSILACLKPGGEALLITMNRTTLISEVHRFLNSHVKWGHYVTGFENAFSFWDRSVAETEELLATCGWTNPRCEIQHHLPSTEFRTKLFMKTLLGISSLIPESEQEAYFEDIWQWALSRYEVETQAGYVFLPIDLMVMQASKPL